MDYDQGKVDDMVLAPLWLMQTGDGRAWKSHALGCDGAAARQAGISPTRRAKRSRWC
jgi:hypothetical protein